ncbi:MAG: hypothetical protein ACRDTJ_32090 [Pseudonocardiaceae bacterium]
MIFAAARPGVVVGAQPRGHRYPPAQDNLPATTQREITLALVAGDRDGPQPEHAAQLDRRDADTSGAAVHQDGLTGLRTSAPDQREQPGQVIEGSSRARLEAHVIGQRQDPSGVRGEDFLPTAV